MRNHPSGPKQKQYAYNPHGYVVPIPKIGLNRRFLKPPVEVVMQVIEAGNVMIPSFVFIERLCSPNLARLIFSLDLRRSLAAALLYLKR